MIVKLRATPTAVVTVPVAPNERVWPSREALRTDGPQSGHRSKSHNSCHTTGAGASMSRWVQSRLIDPTYRSIRSKEAVGRYPPSAPMPCPSSLTPSTSNRIIMIAELCTDMKSLIEPSGPAARSLATR